MSTLSEIQQMSFYILVAVDPTAREMEYSNAQGLLFNSGHVPFFEIVFMIYIYSMRNFEAYMPSCRR